MKPQDGAIRSLVGGFDFTQNKFNHVTQAWRQPGSTFKPFIYSAALEKGYGPATIVNDAPVSYPAGPGQDNWEPKDDDPPGGPTPLRVALQKSINLVSIRLLDAIGVPYAQQFVTQHFGFDADKTPLYLPDASRAETMSAFHATPPARHTLPLSPPSRIMMRLICTASRWTE